MARAPRTRSRSTAIGERGDQALGQFAVQFHLEDQDKFAIGAHGLAATYTGGGFAAMRRNAIRSYTWFNWLYPLSF